MVLESGFHQLQLYMYHVSDLVEEDYSCTTEHNSLIAVLSGTAAAVIWLSFNITFIYLG